LKGDLYDKHADFIHFTPPALGVRRWQWPTVDVVLVPIMTVDLAPFGANALKIPSGGWFP
jgi:K+ transporter